MDAEPSLPSPIALFATPVLLLGETVLMVLGAYVARRWWNVGPVWASGLGLYLIILSSAGLLMAALVTIEGFFLS